MLEAHGVGREVGGGGCSVGGSGGGGSSEGAGGTAVHPAVPFVEFRWRLNPEPGAGLGTPPEWG